MMEEQIKNIYRCIKELSDLNLQKKLWLNENNDTGLISSYSELLSSLYDDFDFDDFVDIDAEKVGLSDKVILEMKKLRILLDNYVEKENDEDIIRDINWHKVTKQAEKVIKIWNGDKSMDQDNISSGISKFQIKYAK